MKPKLALVARNVPPLYGGGGMLARSLAIGFEKRGYHVDLLTDTPAPTPIDKCTVLSPYTTKPTSSPVKRLLRRWFEYKWLKQQIKKANYNIVYGVSAQAFTLSAVHAAKRLGIPTAFETSLFGNDDYLTICRHRLGFILKRFFLCADKIVNISPLLEKACLDGGISANRLEMIPNPVNEDAFHPVSVDEKKKLRTKLSLPEDAKVLFSAGAVCHRKGYDRLISAFIEIAQAEPTSILALAGPLGEDKDSRLFTNKLQAAINQSGLTDRVQWLGRINNVNEWMQAADIFIFASRREGFGTVFTEAIAVGLPIVAYSIDGITDYIFNENCGAYIIDTERQFINATISLTNSKELRINKAKTLRHHYIQYFSADVILDQYKQLFETITQNQRYD